MSLVMYSVYLTRRSVHKDDRDRMLIFATSAQLRTWGRQANARALFENASTLAGKTVFLSHTTADDDDLVAGAVLILQNHGGKVYVDHQDPALPESDCTAIADHLRNVIRACGKFVMLASPETKDSRWIPWELGLGDGIHNQNNVALFPSAESPFDKGWSEREYLSLYWRIILGNLGDEPDLRWLVWDHISNEAIPLEKWL